MRLIIRKRVESLDSSLALSALWYSSVQWQHGFNCEAYDFLILVDGAEVVDTSYVYA
jgi:hypothetical protein